MLKCFFTPFFTGVWEKLLRFLLIIYSLNYRGSEVPASRGHGWCTWTPTGAVQCFHWELQYSHSIILSKAAAWLLPTKGRPVPNPCSASLAEKTYSLFYFFFFQTSGISGQTWKYQSETSLLMFSSLETSFIFHSSEDFSLRSTAVTNTHAYAIDNQIWSLW